MKLARLLMLACVFGSMACGSAFADESQATPPVNPPTAPISHPEVKPPKDGTVKPPQEHPNSTTPKTPESNTPTTEKKDATLDAKLIYVKMTTSLGDIYLELNNEKAPISVKNFMAYVNKHFYDGTIFHRVMSNFMIQGGGFTPDLAQKETDKPIKNEWTNGLKNIRGSIAMARTHIADSATSQFFINVVDNPFLDQPNDGAAYAVFGRVVAGMRVVDKIRNVKTTRKMASGNKMDDVPIDPVVIKSVTVTTADEANKAAAEDEQR